MFDQHGMIRLPCKEQDASPAVVAQRYDEWIFRIENGRTGRQHRVDYGLLDVRHTFGRIDRIMSQVIGMPHVRDDGHRAFVEAESFAQDPAPSHLAYRRRDAWMRKDGSSAGGPTAVAARDATLANLNAIAGGLSDQMPLQSAAGESPAV